MRTVYLERSFKCAIFGAEYEVCNIDGGIMLVVMRPRRRYVLEKHDHRWVVARNTSAAAECSQMYRFRLDKTKP